jgi:hypothetical protein
MPPPRPQLLADRRMRRYVLLRRHFSFCVAPLVPPKCFLSLSQSITPTELTLLQSVCVCQNCATSTTPLWRRDESGSVLCNACGLFLKLHGRPRPISLKTDVIKSRNRVKTGGPGGRKKVHHLLLLFVHSS